jgi:hypothetical protein
MGRTKHQSGTTNHFDGKYFYNIGEKQDLLLSKEDPNQSRWKLFWKWICRIKPLPPAGSAVEGFAAD